MDSPKKIPIKVTHRRSHTCNTHNNDNKVRTQLIMSIFPVPGCILAELYTGYPTFPGENEIEQLACIMEVLGAPPDNVIAHASRKRLFFGKCPIRPSSTAALSPSLSHLPLIRHEHVIIWSKSETSLEILWSYERFSDPLATASSEKIRKIQLFLLDLSMRILDSSFIDQVNDSFVDSSQPHVRLRPITFLLFLPFQSLSNLSIFLYKLLLW